LNFVFNEKMVMQERNLMRAEFRFFTIYVNYVSIYALEVRERRACGAEWPQRLFSREYSHSQLLLLLLY